MALHLLNDGAVPIVTRVHALQVVHQLRLGGSITPRDALRIRTASARRRRELREAARRWSV